MSSSTNKVTPKNESKPIIAKDNRTQAEKDKQQAAKKHEDKKDASGKPSNKSGCC